MSKSVEELFRRAPIDAMYAREYAGGIDFYKSGDIGFLYYDEERWEKALFVREADLVGRPAPQPKPWSGPEDGLPPVGTVCEYSLGDSNCWYVCEIKYVLRDGDGLVAECHLKPSIEQYLNTYQGTECLATFREIKTNQQIAAEKRETAIRELMDIAGVDCRVTAARLVDAGFKREVV